MRFCIDTNVFFSFQKNIDLGDSPANVAQTLSRVGSSGRVQFSLPPKIVEELRSLIDPSAQGAIEQFVSIANVQSPTTHDKTVGVTILYDYVRESRQRTTHGLRVAEDAVVTTAERFTGLGKLSRIDLQKSLQPIKENLRLRFRNATRTGFLDSEADLDLLFLAREVDAYLVSADEGVVEWGRKIGVKEMGLPNFGATIRSVLDKG